jgi:purine-binding chemotaxis protein CheW
VNIDKIENKILADGICLGTIDIRGNTVPVIKFGALLGFESDATDDISQKDCKRVIVMKAGDDLFGLLVDSLNSIISYYDDELAPFPALGDCKINMLAGCISSPDGSAQTIVLNHDEILIAKEITSITKRNSVLFKDGPEKSREQKKGALSRNTLITFSLDSRYGLDMTDVREVINYPDDLIRSLNMSRNLRGMINLRGELIAVIDTRVLYKMNESDESSVSKVLVFENDGMKLGLLVDSVDSIVPFSEDELIEIPQFMFSSSDRMISEDVKKALIIKDDSESQTICILDLPSVSARMRL